MRGNNMIQNLLRFIEEGKSVYHVTKDLSDYLQKNDFKHLSFEEPFRLEKGGKYFLRKNGAVIAFRVYDADSFRIITSHTDSPSIKIKSYPDIRSAGYHQLNVEVYGGPILSTWFDKPLSIAGVVQYEKNGTVTEELFDFKKPICVIPNLAIHMNREVNNGVKVDKQKDLKPILSAIKEADEKSSLAQMLAEEIGIAEKDILSYELNLYNVQPPCLFGADDQFILAPRMDNLSMVMSSVESLIATENGKGIALCACLDHEEIGSKTIVGGDSAFLSNILERIAIGLGMDREQYMIALEKSFVISADLAHSVHPNFMEKADPTNQPIINKGFVIKHSSNMRYATNSGTEAYLIQLADKNKIPYQRFYNHSNEVGGTSLGPIVAAGLPIRTIDIGNPILAMHSERETGGVEDYESIIRLFGAFFGDCR